MTNVLIRSEIIFACQACPSLSKWVQRRCIQLNTFFTIKVIMMMMMIRVLNLFLICVVKIDIFYFFVDLCCHMVLNKTLVTQVRMPWGWLWLFGRFDSTSFVTVFKFIPAIKLDQILLQEMASKALAIGAVPSNQLWLEGILQKTHRFKLRVSFELVSTSNV